MSSGGTEDWNLQEQIRSGDRDLEIIHIEVIVKFLKLDELQEEVNQQEKQKARNGVLGNI